MASIFQNPKFVSAEGYSGFDMSQVVKCTGQIGELKPVYFDILQPGDKVDCSVTMKTRTEPIETPAFASLSEHVDWFFVPLDQIYKPFKDVFFGISDFESDMLVNPTFVPTPKAAVFPNVKIWQLFCNSLRSTTLGTDDAGVDFRISMLRLADALGIPVKNLFPYGSDYQAGNHDYTTTPWLFAAYQKIYYDHYRISERQDNVPEAYNFDSLFGAAAASKVFSVTARPDMFKTRYIRIDKDYFTNVFPAPLIPSNGQSSFDDIVSYGLLKGSDLRLGVNNDLGANPSTYNITPGSSGTPVQVGNIVASGNASRTMTSQIRNSFALEKLLEVTRRAGKHYDAQVLAHFGISVPQGQSGECFFLGSDSQDFVIGDVVSTSASDVTGTEPLGTLAGKGYSMPNGNGSRCKFEAKVHGVLMAIHYVKPIVDYRQEGLHPLHSMVDPGRFFKPALDNLGMVPQYNYEAAFVADNVSRIRGWQYPFAWLKTKYPRVFGGLIGLDQNWTTAKTLIAHNGYPYSDYIVKPDFTNDIFTSQVSANLSALDADDDNQTMATNYGRMYSRDPFLHQMFFDVKKASKMSTFGLPKLQ